jgi:seryl-tRNA synthetase
VFAVALIMLIAGFGGVLPTSLKVGDVEVAIDQARRQGAAAVENVATASDPQAAAQRVKQQHPELASQVDGVKDAVQGAMAQGASMVASVPTAPDPQAAAQQVQQEHPELAREAAAVAVVALTDPRTLREAAEKGILEEQLANVDPANIQPITSADVEVAIREARQHGDGSQVKS